MRVVWQGRRKADGARVLIVNSGTTANKFYPVAVIGSHLSCGCKSGREGGYCKHRAAARRFLAEEAHNRPITIWR